MADSSTQPSHPRRSEPISKPAGLHLKKRLRLSHVRGPPHLSLLRRADDHHRDVRTRLPAPPVAPTVNRPRQLMTNTLVSPPSAAPPLRRRDLAGSAHAQPTATASAAFV